MAAPAKAGAIAPIDVFVPGQNTGLGPEKTSFFQALSIATKITKGTVEIMVSFVEFFSKLLKSFRKSNFVLLLPATMLCTYIHVCMYILTVHTYSFFYSLEIRCIPCSVVTILLKVYYDNILLSRHVPRYITILAYCKIGR